MPLLGSAAPLVLGTDPERNLTSNGANPYPPLSRAAPPLHMGGRGLRGGPGSLPWDFSQLVDPPTHPTSDVWAKAEGAQAAPSAANTNKCSLMFVSLGLSLPAPGPCEQWGAGRGPPDVVVPQPRYMPRGHKWPSPLLKGDPGAKRWLETPSGVGDGVERGEGLVGDVAP